MSRSAGGGPRWHILRSGDFTSPSCSGDGTCPDSIGISPSYCGLFARRFVEAILDRHFVGADGPMAGLRWSPPDSSNRSFRPASGDCALLVWMIKSLESAKGIEPPTYGLRRVFNPNC